jgi:putative ABC transport system ATP-binding protein
MIKYENVSIEFDGKRILDNFNLSIDEQEKVILYGKSGIGKSTIFKLLLGFIRPDSGKIYFEGKELNKDLVKEIRKKTSYISQNTDIGEGNINDFMEYVFNFKTNKDKFDEKKFDELLEYFELSNDTKNKDIEKLSGGEKQRIAIIVSILLKRNIYLLDEITSSLDSKLKHKVIEYFINKDDWTVIVISHDEDWLSSNNIRVVDIEKVVMK